MDELCLFGYQDAKNKFRCTMTRNGPRICPCELYYPVYLRRVRERVMINRGLWPQNAILVGE